MSALSGKVIFITGGAAGIGEATADAFLQKGCKVSICDYDKAAGEAKAKEFAEKYGKDKVMFCVADVSTTQLDDAFKTTVDRFGRIDVIYNNAGIFDEANWEKMIAINLNGVIRGTYLAFDHMNKKKGGHGGVVVSTASVCGLSCYAGFQAYCASKHGVIAFSRSCAEPEFSAESGVKFVCVCPGLVQTNMANKPVDDDNIKNFIGRSVTAETAMMPSEVAAAVVKIVQEGENGAAWIVVHNKIVPYQFPPECYFSMCE